MKKLLTVFLAVLLIFTFASFAAAQESDPLEGVQVYDGDFQWVPGALPWALFIPHYDIGGEWWTGLVLQNMSGVGNMYKMYFCDNDGYIQATKDGAFTSFQKAAWMMTMSMTGSCSTGWMVIESEFQLLGFVNYGQSGISVTTLGPFWSN